MELSFENAQENLQVYLEHDSGYDPNWDIHSDGFESENIVKDAINQILVFNGSEEKPLAGAYYVTVNEGYPGNMSPGQEKLYQMLLTMQKGSLYAITTMGQLAEAMEIKVIWAAYQRLDNLKTINAISWVESKKDEQRE